jgi:hypothetical protein
MRAIAGIAILLAIAPAGPGVVHAQGKSFEGTVTFESRMDGESDAFAYSMKGTRVRIDPQRAEMPMYMVMDANSQTVRMVMMSENAYMEMELPGGDDEPTDLENEPVNTGRTDEVAGRKCEIWTMKADGDDYEMCVARDMGSFMGGGGGPMGRNASSAWQRELRKGGFFPLRVVEKTGGQNETVMIATKIEEKKLDDSMFDVPAGAKKMSMPGGMRP